MRVPIALYMALKYIRPKKSFLSIISVISVVGVVLGVAVLIIVLSVMSGFDDMWRNKILSFNAHITVSEYDLIYDWRQMADIIEQDPDVTGAAPYLQGLVFAQHGDRILAPAARGVEVELERNVSEIPANMFEGRFEMDENEVVVGRELARHLGIGIGDSILAHYPQNMISKNELILPEELVVAGIFELGMWEYDMGFILTPMSTARELFGLHEGVHAIRVMTKNPLRADIVAERLKKTLRMDFPGSDVKTWSELNRQLFAVLKVEKNMMFFLLVFIILVAAFGITNTLIVTVVQKTKEIGLLKAIGFSSLDVMGIFIWQGCIQGIVGSFFGMGLGFTALYYRNDLMRWISNTFNLELFPKEFYRLSEIPALVSVKDVLLIAGLAIVICTLSGLIPAYRALRLNPAKALRYE